jgi:GDP-mannose 6-dehydrogenase
MKIAIFGLGYVGLTAAACLTREGHEVFGIDVSDEKIAAVNAGRSPIAEPGISELIEAAVTKGLLHATKNAAPHINACEMAFVCVGTPSAPDGSHNMTYIAEVSRQIAAMIDPARPEYLTVVYRSTMRPGTTEDLIEPIFEQQLGTDSGKVELVYCPEFMRESVAIDDYFHPPKIVIGTRDGGACQRLDQLNAQIVAPRFYTHYREAELTKFVDNTFHAVKTAFANEIGRVCVQLGINAQTVHQIFVADTILNISPAYLRPGGAFGGSCLPKDVRALQYIASDAGADTHLVDSLLRSNEAHKHFLFENCVKGLPARGKVLMLGIAFKSNSDDLRESPNIDLARKLLQASFELSIYDPQIVPSKLLGQNLGYAFSNLPKLTRMLVSKSVAESGQFDLVVDTRGWAKTLSFKPGQKIVDVNTLS